MIGALVLLYLWDSFVRRHARRAGSSRQQYLRLGRIARERRRPAARPARAGRGNSDGARDGLVFRSANQPPVVGEILGVSCSVRRCSDVSCRARRHICSGHGSGPYLNIIAQVGVILYMFLVGLELDPSLCCANAGTRQLRFRTRASSRRSCWARRLRSIFIRSSRPATCRSRASRFFWASRCR